MCRVVYSKLVYNEPFASHVPTSSITLDEMKQAYYDAVLAFVRSRGWPVAVPMLGDTAIKNLIAETNVANVAHSIAVMQRHHLAPIDRNTQVRECGFMRTYFLAMWWGW